MAFSDYQKERIERVLNEKHVHFTGKKMMGGYCFLVDDKMLLGLDIDKKTGFDRLMLRLGEESVETHLKKKGCRPMDFTGKPMKDFIYVDPEGFDFEEDLSNWIHACLEFNPRANKTKK